MILIGQLASATAAQACTVPVPTPVMCIRKGDPPPGFEQWDATVAATGPLAPGHAVAVPLRLSAPSDGKPSCAGSTTVRIAKSGIYGFALSGGAWIELVGKRGALDSIAHAHGPVCSGIAKTVDFKLAPGRYRVSLSRAAGASITLMAVRR